MYKFAMVKCLFLFKWILTNCISVLCVLMFLGMCKWVNVMLYLMYVSSPPTNFPVCVYGSVVCYFGCFGCSGDRACFLVL